MRPPFPWIALKTHHQYIPEDIQHISVGECQLCLPNEMEFSKAISIKRDQSAYVYVES